jgi:hypothetical protein
MKQSFAVRHVGLNELAVIAVFILAAALCGSGQTPGNVTAWTNGLWFDGATFHKREMYSVNGRLTTKRPQTIDKEVDLKGGYVTPAFGEAHNHNLPAPNTPTMIKTYLSQGIFYVMVQGNIPEARAQLSGLINTPGSIDVVFANGIFTAPGGHPSALVERNIRGGSMSAADRDGGFLLPVSSTSDVDRQWMRVRSQRPDFIKMILAYSEERIAGWSPPRDSDRYGLDPHNIPRHIVKLAHRDKIRVSAHVESAADFDVALAAGVDVVAHMPGFWPDPLRIASKGVGIYEISEDAAKRAGRQHVTVVTTLGGQLRDFEGGSATGSYRHPLLEVYRRNMAILTKYDVRIAIGSDQYRSTSIPEALAIHKAGLMDSRSLLRALSTDSARTILPGRSSFDLTKGSSADFLVFEADPVADFSAIERIRLRVKDGQRIP